MDNGRAVALGVLGPLVVRRDDGTEVDLRGTRQRRLLAVLAAGHGTTVSSDALADALWPGALPQNPAAALQSQVARLRRALAGPTPVAVVTDPTGYHLDVGRDRYDATRFEDLSGARLGEVAAIDDLQEAAALWRGEAFAEFADLDTLAIEARRLAELRATADDRLGEALLAAGRDDDARVHLAQVIHRCPHRERPVRLLMDALAAAGRHGDALAEAHQFRRRLAEDLGLDPSIELRDHEQALAAGTRTSDAAERGSPRSPAPGSGARAPGAAAIVTGAAPEPPGRDRRFDPPPRLVGRDVHSPQLDALVVPATVVTAIGPGGVGKTSLAASVADRRRNAGATVHVGLLAPLPPDASAITVANALGFESPDAAAMVLTDAPALVVLDNCEHVLDAVRDLLRVVLPSALESSFLATSREPIGIGGEHVFVVPPLDLPAPGSPDAEASPAVTLFLERAAAAGATVVTSPRQLADVGELCRRLDGIPLAIELAAARSRALAPSDLLAMVDRRLGALHRTRGGSRGGGRRHDSMQAAIDVSINMLTVDERVLFQCLSVFRGPFDLAQAHAVAGRPDTDVLATLDTISALVDRSLVATEAGPGPRRYRLLELLREHAADSLGDDRERIEGRFVEAMAIAADDLLASAVEQWSPDVLARASAQFANLSRAIELCLDREPLPDRCFRLILPLFAAVHEGKAHEVSALGDRVLARWPAAPAPLRAEALAVLATAAALGGRLQDVAGLAEAAVRDPASTAVAAALAERAWAFAARPGDPEAGVRHFRAARTAADVVGFDAVSRELQALEAGELDLAGRRVDALARLDELLHRCAIDDDAFITILAHLIRARVWIRAGDLDAASADLAAATAASAAIEQLWWNAAILRTRAALASLGPSGFGAAAAAWREAVDFAASRGALGEVAITLRAAATVAHHAGAHEAARTLFGAAPRADAITVLPELFPDALADLVAHVPPAPPGASPVDSLTRARRALTHAAATAVQPQPSPGNSSATTRSGVDDAPAGLDPATTATWIREGDVWCLTYGGTTARVRHRKGFADLATLVADVGVEHPAVTLMGGVDAGGDTGPALDDRARREYQQRIAELQHAVDEAIEHNDPARAERAEAELDELVAALAAAFGLGGRARSSGSTSERARSAVTARIRAAIDLLDEAHPLLGAHLRNAVRTGTWCSYSPELDPGWVVEA